jgi:hypothetical protein
MARQHNRLWSRIPRNGFLAALFLVGLGWASLARAQDDTLSVSPMPQLETVGDTGLRAYVASLPSAPTPKIEPAVNAIIVQQSHAQISIERGHRFYWLDRTSFLYGLVLGGAETFDGATTRYFIHHCSLCFEHDPMSLLGAHPSWDKMIPTGMLEAAVATYSYKKLSRSPHRFMRAAAPLVPVGLTTVHLIEGARNISLKNKYRCADPGYVVVGTVCVLAPPPVLTGATGALGGHFGSRDNPL